MSKNLKFKDKLVVGRKWNNPEIYTIINKEGIEMQIELKDFIEALCAEMGSPAMVMTRAGLKVKVKQACDKVLNEIKTASREVT